ncbi:MAG: PspC domain-containing protein [Actinomycetota bacterium]
MDTIDTAPPVPPKRLLRSTTNRWMAGVAGGLAGYFTVDANLIRLLFVLLTICGGIGIPTYLVAWLIIPREDEAQSIGERMIGRVNQATPVAPNKNH